MNAFRKQFALSTLFAGMGLLALILSARSAVVEHFHQQERVIESLVGQHSETGVYEDETLHSQDGCLEIGIEKLHDWRNWLVGDGTLWEVKSARIWPIKKSFAKEEDNCAQIIRLESVLAELATFKSLQRLSIYPYVSDRQITLLSRFPGLRWLELNGNPARDDKLDWLTDRATTVISQMKKLRSLSINESRITDDGITNLSALPEMLFLELSGDFTGSTLFRLRRLRSLDITSSRLSPAFFQNLRLYRDYESLGLSAARVSLKDAALISELPRLKTLSLDGVVFANERAKDAQPVKPLGLGGMTGNSAMPVNESADFSRVRALQVQPDELGIEHGVILAITRCLMLEALEVARVPLSQCNIDDFCRLKSLKSLDIVEGGISDEQILQLRESLPNTSVRAR